MTTRQYLSLEQYWWIIVVFGSSTTAAMRRCFMHVAVGKGDSPRKLLPVYFHYLDSNWFAADSMAILSEITELILDNLELIEQRARAGDSSAESRPPLRLNACSGKLSMAFTTSARRPYTLLSFADGTGSSPTECSISSFNLIAWVAPINPSKPYMPMPFECS
jgi:hypothetical protein